MIYQPKMRSLNCIVTGASSGIGKSISLELSKFAKHIYIIARNIKKLEEVNDEIIDNGCDCTIVPLDLTQENVIENLSVKVFQKDNVIDIMVLSAGQISELSPVDSIDLNKLNDILKINFLCNFRMIRNFHPLLINSENSHLAVISSFKDASKEEYWGIYQPIMTALNELINIYAMENKNTKIKINVYDPGNVDTRLRESIMPGESKDDIRSPKEVAIKIVDYILQGKTSGRFIKI